MPDKPKTSPLRFFLIAVAALTVAAIVALAALRYSGNNQVTNVAADSISTDKPLEAPAASESTSVSTSESAQKSTLDESATNRHALDPVLELARESLKKIQNEVDDYKGRLIKRERIHGKLANEVQMDFKIRTRREADGKVIRPLSAYLKFNEPRSARGREVIWTEGANDNKLIAHEGGLLNLLRVELDPNGRLAMIDNKYPITEIGLTRLIEKLIEKGERDRKVGPCEVQVFEDQHVGDRTCRLVQVTHPDKDARFDFHIAQVFIDVERMIPLRYAAFLWPTEPGGEPQLEEEYTYLDVQLNVGLSDIDFDPDNSAYNYP